MSTTKNYIITTKYLNWYRIISILIIIRIVLINATPRKDKNESTCWLILTIY